MIAVARTLPSGDLLIARLEEHLAEFKSQHPEAAA
jgi:hypothetical protein